MGINQRGTPLNQPRDKHEAPKLGHGNDITGSNNASLHR
jgi:hypothetical protein